MGGCVDGEILRHCEVVWLCLRQERRWWAGCVGCERVVGWCVVCVSVVCWWLGTCMGGGFRCVEKGEGGCDEEEARV
jgi:hypothetical protein